MASNSPFDPSGEYANMELLSPSPSAYRKYSLFATFVGSMIVTGGFIAVVVLGWQHKLSEEYQFATPLPTFFIYIASAILLRWLVCSSRPVMLFLNHEDNSLYLVTNGIFNRSKTVKDISDLEEVIVSEESRKWKVDLKFKGGGLLTIPRCDIYEARQSAIRISKRGEVSLSGENADGDSIADVITEQPLYKRLTESEVPRIEAKLLIDKEKLKGGIKWDVNLPAWISYLIFAFAFVNVAAGLYIWTMLDKEVARWASIPFIMTTFVVFVIAAMIKSLKRPIDLDISGIKHRGMHIPLSRIQNIDVKKGFILSRLHVVSPEENLFLLTTTKQAEWLKADIEHEIWVRRGQIAEG